MTDSSARLALPYIQPAQAQKHVTHNEAVQRLDLLVQLVVEAFGAAIPPAQPDEGRIWALGPVPADAWAGQAGMLAARIASAWVFISPQPGWRAWGAAEQQLRIWDGTGWAREALDDIDGLGVGTGFDATNRLAVSSPATLLSHAGAGHQLKINKALLTDTASLLFQTGFSGRAEMGTAASDDFSVKVSPDGLTWAEGLVIDAATGQARLPGGAWVNGAIAGPGAGNLPLLRSHATDTGTVTTDHMTAVIASVNARASGNRAVVLSSDGGTSSGDSAVCISSDGASLTGIRNFAVSSLNGVTAGFDAGLMGTLDSSVDGFRTAVIASYNSGVAANTGDAVVTCSRRVLNTVTRSLALGDASAGGPSTANRTIHMFSATGDIQIAGSLSSSHAFSDFAEMFANATGAEIPLGTIVTEEGGAVRPAGAGDEIAGVVTATAVVTAGDTPFAWQGRYLSDEWGRQLYDDVPDPDYGGTGEAPLIRVRRENPAYDPSHPQVPRSQRPDQWTQVGLLGQVFTRVGADVRPGDRLTAEGGVGVTSPDRTGLRCMTITQAYDAAKGYAIGRCLVNVRV